MLLKGLDGSFAYVPKSAFEASKVSQKYWEIEEVGSGSFG